MKTEKIVISFIAVLVGILASGVAFFLYQSTKVISPSNTKTVTVQNLKPTPKISPISSFFLTVDSPRDESVVADRIVTLAGKTNSSAIILIQTAENDQVLSPAKNGDFSTTVTLDNGANYIEITAMAPNGEETKVNRTITVSSESF